MWKVLTNVRTIHNGATHEIKAGVYDALPDGVGEQLEKEQLAIRLKPRAPEPATTEGTREQPKQAKKGGNKK